MTIQDIDNSTSSVKEIMGTVLSKIVKKQKDKSIQGLPTGFGELDNMLSGLCDGHLIVVAGHPGIGATAFALRIIEHLSVDNGIAGLYFSMSISKEGVIERMLLGRAGVDLRSVHIDSSIEMTQKDLDVIHEQAKIISEKPLYIDETSRLSPCEILQRAKDAKASKGIKFIVVDFLQTMRLGNTIDLHEKEYAQIAQHLKLVSLELNMPVLLLAELNFDLIRYDDVDISPRIVDLGQAISIERYADVMMLIEREKYYGNHTPATWNTARIIVTKNSNNSTGIVHLQFFTDLARFENIASF